MIVFLFFYWQVITAGEPRNNQEKGRGNGPRQRIEKKNEGEDGAVVEIDSRLLSALLTVSQIPLWFSLQIPFIIYTNWSILFRLAVFANLSFGKKVISYSWDIVQGVNRAFPYVAAEDVHILIEEHTHALFRLVL